MKSLKVNWPVTPAAWEVAIRPASCMSAMPARLTVGPTLVQVLPSVEW